MIVDKIITIFFVTLIGLSIFTIVSLVVVGIYSKDPVLIERDTLNNEHIILHKEIKSLRSKVDYLTWISTNTVNRQAAQGRAN